jgi:hypothetical protein
MALKCNCVTVRRDFDNESAGRREVLFPSVPNPLDASSSEFNIVSLVEASASRMFRAFNIDGTRRAPSFSSRSTRDEEIY